MSALSGQLVRSGSLDRVLTGVCIDVHPRLLKAVKIPMFQQVDVVPSGTVSEALEALKIAHNTIKVFDPNEMGREDEVVAALKTIDLAIEKLEGGES